MTTSVLPEDFTLRDMTGALGQREEFARGCLDAMYKARRAYGEVVVRFGRTGRGIIPNYRFEGVPSGALLVAIDGGTHEPWDPAYSFDGNGTWSTSTMTLSEVAQLRKDLNALTR